MYEKHGMIDRLDYLSNPGKQAERIALFPYKPHLEISSQRERKSSSPILPYDRNINDSPRDM